MTLSTGGGALSLGLQVSSPCCGCLLLSRRRTHAACQPIRNRGSESMLLCRLRTLGKAHLLRVSDSSRHQSSTASSDIPMYSQQLSPMSAVRRPRARWRDGCTVCCQQRNLRAAAAVWKPRQCSDAAVTRAGLSAGEQSLSATVSDGADTKPVGGDQPSQTDASSEKPVESSPTSGTTLIKAFHLVSIPPPTSAV